MKSKYEIVEDGTEERYTLNKDHKIACCDCSLVHKFRFRIKRRRLYVKITRDNRATGQLRRHCGRKVSR
jgi:hypothetical protein